MVDEVTCFSPERGLMPGGPTGRDAVPTDLLVQARRRLTLTAATICAVLGVVIALGVLAHEARGLAASREVWLDRARQGAFFSLSLLTVGVLGITRRRPARVVEVGSAYQLLGALLISLMAFAVEPHLQATPSHLTWLGVWIVLFPLLAPATPARAALQSLLSAAMAPLVYVAAITARGTPWPDASLLLATFLPYPMCAVLSLLPSLVLTKMVREVRTARDEASVVGQYRLIERIGVGGMGEVWRAEHQMLARPAAVKLMRPTIEGATPEESLARFEREASSTARLRSPHTVSLYDYGVASDDTAFYAMELLEGLDLHALVARDGPVPPGRAIHLVQQAAEALAEAHAAGLVHRDIKPGNLFVARLGVSVDVVKVMDFGLVSLREPPPGDRRCVTDPKLVVGTPAYMAPEQALGAADARSDIYSLGCVLYWLLTGTPVFAGDSPVHVLIDHARRSPRPLRARNPSIPADLEAVVMACLAKAPEDRPQTALELHERLAACASAGSWTPADARAWWATRDRSDVERTGPSPGSAGARRRMAGTVTRELRGAP